MIPFDVIISKYVHWIEFIAKTYDAKCNYLADGTVGSITKGDQNVPCYTTVTTDMIRGKLVFGALPYHQALLARSVRILYVPTRDGKWPRNVRELTIAGAHISKHMRMVECEEDEILSAPVPAETARLPVDSVQVCTVPTNPETDVNLLPNGDGQVVYAAIDDALRSSARVVPSAVGGDHQGDDEEG